jgi:hypothetical protein
MRSFLNKFKINLSPKKIFDAEIISDVKLSENRMPYFVVKMKGCKIPISVKADDIIHKYILKFNQLDIQIATKAYMKHKNMFSLVGIDSNYAILCNKENLNYEVLDLSNYSSIKDAIIDYLNPEDAFKLGVHFEKIQIENDRKLYLSTKKISNPPYLKLVSEDEP